ncbi:class Ib ribonucleoside-diphosphate reductase assembly flavoprotein NrdI [Spiroplasma endosymbiont of Aspidapion aeneum]|uniref:class Ib ribonucleoside-diphosphate reductase assembly flavoprotein NrdI n=1 Tax=Spiroplasma endosymbiont of Aspidapion aeneum TaxID=3066276 RepID=UPI00313D3BC8
MHKDIVRVHKSEIRRPKNDIHIVYFSSKSNNTHRFILKLDGIKSTRIPIEIEESLFVDCDYVLITPTYGGGGSDISGSVPKQVIKFLNNETNRKLCYGVIASGNTNFGDSFAIAGPIISKKLGIPLLYQFELLGTKVDTINVIKILKNFWEE